MRLPDDLSAYENKSVADLLNMMGIASKRLAGFDISDGRDGITVLTFPNGSKETIKNATRRSAEENKVLAVRLYMELCS